MYAKGISGKKIAHKLGMGKTSVYRVLRLHNKK